MRSIPLGLILFFGLLTWQLPIIIRNLSVRFDSAYPPRAIQALAAHDQIMILPAAAVKIEATSVLANGLLPNDWHVDDVLADIES